MAIFFFFEDNRYNLLVYFTITTLVLWAGPERWVPSLSRTRGVPVVTAPAGNVSGIRMTSRDGRDIFAYKGIPYAHPPVGPLRFQRPKALEEPFPSGHDGTSRGNRCVQPLKLGPGLATYVGSEDCLNLNVYVPNREDQDTKKLLPVMFWIHGGGYVLGQSADLEYGPQYLLDRDIVLVTANYRLGPFGFLNLGIEEIPGNQGIWDQRLALEWVQQNVASFGGDPKRVTIFGESAGSMSVLANLVANNNGGKKLFSAAIAQSGTPFSPFSSIDRKRSLISLHSTFASHVGCDGKDAVECLQAKGLGDFYVDPLFIFDECNINALNAFPFPAVWKPSPDSSFSSEPLFPARPNVLFDEGHFAKDIPLMIGHTKDDGLIITAYLTQRPDFVQRLKSEWSQCLPHNVLGKSYSDLDETDAAIMRDIEAFYFGKDVTPEDISIETHFRNLTDLFTDTSFAVGTDLVVERYSSASTSPVFYYHFDHLGSKWSMGDLFSNKLHETLWQLLNGIVFGNWWTKGLGVCHADDIIYLFQMFMNLPLSDSDLAMSELMVDLWVNFATHHHPTPKTKDGAFVGHALRDFDSAWKPVDKTRGAASGGYVILKDGKIADGNDKRADDRIAFWRNKVLSRTSTA